MPSTYQQNGIELLYPDNWKVVDEQPRSDPPAVTLQSPGTGYWNLTIYPDSQEPEDLTACHAVASSVLVQDKVLDWSNTLDPEPP